MLGSTPGPVLVKDAEMHKRSLLKTGPGIPALVPSSRNQVECEQNPLVNKLEGGTESKDQLAKEFQNTVAPVSHAGANESSGKNDQVGVSLHMYGRDRLKLRINQICTRKPGTICAPIESVPSLRTTRSWG